MKSLNWTESHPVEAAIFVASLGLFIYAIASLWPLHTVTALAAGLPGIFKYLAAAYFSITAAPGLIAPFSKKVPNLWLEKATFSLFLSYLFLTILRVGVYGWFPFTWFSLIVVSLMCGVFRIYLRSHRK